VVEGQLVWRLCMVHESAHVPATMMDVVRDMCLDVNAGMLQL
jgi:hypothetical protein